MNKVYNKYIMINGLHYVLLYSFYLVYPHKICSIKITSQCKILIVPGKGWFGQPKYSIHIKKSFYVVSASASITEF